MTESTFSLRDIAATERLARSFAASIEERAIIALNGPLGVGKTKFVQSLAEAIGVEELVNSPTFTMLNEYHSGRLPLFHFDLYRLSEGEGRSAAEMFEAELAEIMGGSYLILIEWAELLEKPELSAANFLKRLDYLTAQFSYDEVLNENPIEKSSSLYKEEQARLVRILPRGQASLQLLNRVIKEEAQLKA